MGFRSADQIDFTELVSRISSNHNKETIEHIRELRRRNEPKYKELKEGWPNITPNCLVRVQKGLIRRMEGLVEIVIGELGELFPGRL